MGRMLYTFLALLSLAGCNRAQDTLVTSGPIRPAFLDADSLAVDSILNTLSRAMDCPAFQDSRRAASPKKARCAGERIRSERMGTARSEDSMNCK